jgi:outer membrane protein TolC
MTKRKKHNQSFWPFVFLAGLSSCTFGSGLHSPCPDIEWCPTIKSFEICPPEQPVIEVPDTKEPINLCTLIDIGLKNNPTSRNDWQLARAAAFNLIAAKAALYPTASGIEQFDYIDQSFGSNLGGVNTSSGGVAATTAASALKHFWDMESQINISYLLFDFGGRCASIESSRQALFAANWQFNRAIQTVIFDVANDYYTYIENKALLEARLEDLKNATEDFKAAEAQFIAGIVNKLDMLQAKSTMLQAQLNVVTQKNLVETSFVQLLFDMGLPANTHFEVVELPKNYEFQKIEIEYDLVKMLEDALILRPDLEEAYANFMEARALMRRHITLTIPFLIVTCMKAVSL